MRNIPLNAAAILVWLPKGERADGADFDPKSAVSPPHPNPELWWKVGDAIRYAVELDHTDGKLPWIKFHDEVLPPEEISKIYPNLGRGN